MQTDNLIAITEFCKYHNIEVSFISTLQQSGLITIITHEEATFIPADQLLQLEKYVRFHYEWDINLEGIETIMQLLDRIVLLQAENISLRNQLHFYDRNL